MTGESWKIYWNEFYWNEFGRDTYLYGSEIFFHAKDDIEVRNEFMPPGAVIKRWFSKVNYQSMRIEPTLPMIDGEGKYHIRLDVSTEPWGGLLLKIIFYDRYDAEIENRIIREGEGNFQCPLKTFSYEVQLIHSGAAQFHFHSITITEITDGEEKNLSYIKKSKKRKTRSKRAER